MYKIINLTQGSKEWLEYRKNHRNASEIGAVMNVGFIKPYELALQKFHNKECFVTQKMKNGIINEQLGRDYLNKQGYNFKPYVLEWEQNNAYSCSLDGFDIKKNVICEIKNSLHEKNYIKTNKKISDKYYYQVQQQLMISGASKCIFCVINLNDSFEWEYQTLEILPDEKAFNEICKAWDNFYQDYANIELDDELIEISERLTLLSFKKEKLENEIKELKQKAINKAGGKELKALNMTIYKVNSKGSYDYKAYCLANNIKPPKEFFKEPSITWAVRVNY